MDIKRVLMDGLNAPETDADDNQSAAVHRRDVRQAMLNLAADQGLKTQNHVHSRDLQAEAEQSREDAATSAQQELLDAMQRYQDAKNALTVNPAGPGSLNHDFQEWAN